MKITRIARIAIVGLAAAAVVGVSASAASAVQPLPQNASGDFYFANGETDGSVMAEGTSVSFDYAVIGRPDKTDINTHFAADPTAETASLFISPRGSELNPAAWTATGTLTFVPGTKDIWQPSVSLSSMATPGTSSIDTVKANGGDYSIGFAYLKNNGLTVSTGGAYFGYIHVTAGTGAWTFLHSEIGGGNGPEGSPASIDLEATTIAPTDGALSLSVPTGAKVTFAAPTLVNGLSTSTGSLPDVTVQDDRGVSKPGWSLNATVVDFAGPVTIDKKQLGWVPSITSGTTSTGVVAGATQSAGSANWSSAKLASAPAGSGVGTTKLGAALTFVAPANAPVGTYTSKMTLTLVGQ